MQLEWTEPALADLEYIRRHISKDAPVRADRFIARLFQAAERLEDFPIMHTYSLSFVETRI